LWEHYVFTLDEDFLRETAYPLMHEAAQFFVDFLVKDETTGWLISTPSNSPENGGLVAGPVMDHQIIRQLFRNCIAATDILNMDRDFASVLQNKIDSIAPNQIGQYGQLQEWLEDKDDPENHHRHVSHLWAVHPGNEINWQTSPDLMDAAKKSLTMRGDEGTGWSLAWKINFWARFLNGEHAYNMIGMLLSPAEHEERNIRGGSYPNLFDAHPPFQIDGNFGGTAGIIELLLQSHLGELHLLPALPDALNSGSIQGACARGGFVVDMDWEGGKPTRVHILSKGGKICKIRFQDKVVEFLTEKGKGYDLGENFEL
jgi:alpha-L-fucosidase 2